jgi:hypothetical protein
MMATWFGRMRHASLAASLGLSAAIAIALRQAIERPTLTARYALPPRVGTSDPYR